jgi:hypothetical protein
MGQQMIDGMTQLSHMANTLAYLQGARLSSMAAHPEMYNPDGTLNTSRLGQAAPQKQFTPYQQTQALVGQNTAYTKLFEGKPVTNTSPGEPGIGPLADSINKSISEGNKPEAKDIKDFVNKYAQYKQLQSAYGQYAVPNPQIENAFKQIQTKIPELKKAIEKEKAKGTGHWFKENTDTSKVEALNQGIEQLQGLQSAGGGQRNVIRRQGRPRCSIEM